MPPCGGHRPAKFLDRIAGHHETDHALDSYLKPKRFHENRKQRYKLFAHGALKRFNVPKDIFARSSSMTSITPKLKSYYKTTFDEIGDDEIFFAKTDDLESSCGVVYLVHEDKSV